MKNKKIYWMKKESDSIDFDLNTLKFNERFRYNFMITEGNITVSDFEKISQSKYYKLKNSLQKIER